ncbi:hypothetical protein ASPCAL11433 [Aspergillus calidoustus]|uniref:C3H1-type domain-containing protein n=1 Tax=Aspergillus calidoustus TaxID=454130 RepID=A0A0U5CED2_ASPCI|nr:hypothetical protein ASPCAL11433 [Aspergillus calidoustus]
MNPQGFSFPPPPPPPPTQQHQPPQQYHHNAGYTQYGSTHHGQRGGRGGGGGHFRGRGRGHGNRGGGGGGGRGGYHMPSDANRPSAYTPAAAGYGPMNYLGYPTQFMSNQHASVQAPHYTQPQTYQTHLNGNAFASPTQYSQATGQGTPYQRQQPGYDASYSAPSTQQPPYGNAPSSGQPTMMGPPIHWGFDNAGHAGSFHPSHRPSQRGPRQANAHINQPSQGKHTHKRDHSSAFGKPQSTAPRVPAPPPVPSFGNPLPSKPPLPADSPRKPKKKKRKHNQLGLTPKTEDHESSEEEDDADEETRLAASGAGASAGLQVTYRGKTSNLQTSAEIAAWIAERRKRFPTQAKIEEKKKAMEEAKKAKEEAQRQREARKQAATREKKQQQDQQSTNKQPRAALDPADAAAKAKRKAEKLRRKLEKEEKRIAEAEADAERARKLQESQKGTLDATMEPTTTITNEGEHGSELDGQGQEARNPLAGSDPSDIPPTASQSKEESLVYDGTVGDSVSDTSDSSDWTSSSGSDTSSDSDDSDNDSAPEQATSRREGPERVPPPPREGQKRLCRHFARSGRCVRGTNCKFLHEKTERGGKTKPAETKGRKGLLQALLDRQKEDENKKVMETIVWLGENGFLDESAAQVDTAVGSTESNTASRSP